MLVTRAVFNCYSINQILSYFSFPSHTIILKIIRGILRGILVPTHVYLFLSRESCMIDECIDTSDIPFELQYHSVPRNIYSIINQYWTTQKTSTDITNIIGGSYLMMINVWLNMLFLNSWCITLIIIRIVRLRTRLTGFCKNSNLTSMNYTEINHDSFDHYDMRNSNRYYVFNSSYRIREYSIPSLVRLKDMILDYNENSSINGTNSE